MKIDALLGLALTAAQRGDSASATTYYRQGLAIDPTNTSASIGIRQPRPAGSQAPVRSPPPQRHAGTTAC